MDRFCYDFRYAASVICSGKEDTLAKPVQPESKAPIHDPNSTPADLAVPLCPVKYSDSLETNGIASIGEKDVTPPKLVHSVDFDISSEALHAQMKKRLEFIDVIIGFVIDANGTPQEVCIQKSDGYGLDANAAIAVRQSAVRSGQKMGSRCEYGIRRR